MEAVFVFHHVRSDDEYGDNAKLIGIYRTASAAEAAMKRLAYKPGSVDHPTGWQCDRYELDQDHRTEGFGLADIADRGGSR